MTYVLYENWSPSPESKRLLDKINDLVEEYRDIGLRMTLRQLYYALFSRKFIHENSKQAYRRLGALVTSARMGGVLDWDAIEDRNRRPDVPSEFESIDELLNVAYDSFRLPRLVGQPRYVEVWIEKDALANVLLPTASEHHVTLMINKGYSSSSAIRESALRIRRRCADLGVSEATIVYLGDLDPSGEDMVRDIRDRVGMFLNRGQIFNFTAGRPYSGGKVTLETRQEMLKRLPLIDLTVEKLGITYEQVQEHGSPPNVTKKADPRSKGYIARYGKDCWELDALPPPELRRLVTERLGELLDMDTMAQVIEREDRDKRQLNAALAKMREGNKPPPAPKRRKRS